MHHQPISTRYVKALIAERIPELIHDPSCMIDEATKQIKKAHSPQYVKALITGDPGYLSETNGFTWDEGIWEMAVNSTTGVLMRHARLFYQPPVIGRTLQEACHRGCIMLQRGKDPDTVRSMVSLSLRITSITVK